MTRLGLLVLVACAGGCISGREGRQVREVDITPGVTTKEDVIRQIGAPLFVRRQGTDTVLVFSHGVEDGVGYGLGMSAAALVFFESTHVAADSLEVVVGPDRRVRSVRLAENRRETPMTPFDD